MKIITPKITTALLLVVFLVGFVNVADAAFAGKKEVSKTEAVAPGTTDANNAITSFEAPVPAPSTNTLLLVIIALLIPPLAVYLKYGEIGSPFWVNLVLTLLFFIPGVIHALIHVLR